ncbi:MAG: SPOR domain-containing protein [bacterium]|nr:SPOR domain-containing protein [bacterium]
MKTPDYLSYERYKKKKDSNPNKRMILFITTFFVTLLLFSLVAKSLSPDVDVSIGSNSEMEPKETGLGVKRFIDDRLKMIQQDDNSAGVSKIAEAEKKAKMIEYDNNVSEEKMKLPSNSKSEEIEEEPVMPAYNHTAAAPKPSARDYNTPVQSEYTHISKVYVGRYDSMEKAKVAKDILVDSGMNVSPFVKNLGSSYTLQIGTYSSREKAEDIANDLRRNGFPARVVE